MIIAVKSGVIAPLLVVAALAPLNTPYVTEGIGIEVESTATTSTVAVLRIGVVLATATSELL